MCNELGVRLEMGLWWIDRWLFHDGRGGFVVLEPRTNTGNERERDRENYYYEKQIRHVFSFIHPSLVPEIASLKESLPPSSLRGTRSPMSSDTS